MKTNTKISIGATLTLALVSNCFAVGGGLANVTTIFTSFNTLMTGLGAGIIAMAFMYVGYQVAFGGKRIADCFPIIIGAAIAGAATQLASFLFA